MRMCIWFTYVNQWGINKDVNNLTGWGRSKELSAGNLEWKDDIEHFVVLNLTDNSNKVPLLEILEIDLNIFFTVIHLFNLGVNLFLFDIILAESFWVLVFWKAKVLREKYSKCHKTFLF